MCNDRNAFLLPVKNDWFLKVLGNILCLKNAIYNGKGI